MFKQLPLLRCFFLSLLLLVLATSTAAATPTVAVLPLEARSSRDISFLQDAVRDMLATRIGAAPNLSVIERVKVDQVAGGAPPPSDLPSLAAKLAATHLVTGTITALGDNYSLDVKLYPAQGGAPETFYATAQGEGNLITAVDRLAADLISRGFGLGAAASPAPLPQVVSRPAQPTYTTMHPERIFRSAGGGLVGTRGIGGRFGFLKSQNLSMDLQSMALGDVNGDSVEELVLADRTMVYIYRREPNGRLVKVGQFGIPEHLKIHAVTLFDLDGAPGLEILVSAADHLTPASFGVKWLEKSSVTFLFKEAPWYIRAMELPGEGVTLLGQKSGTTTALRPGIYRLAYQDGTLRQESELDLPDSVNLFEFVLADLDNDQALEVVAIDQYDRLKVMRRSGAVLWKSDDFYGGTTRFIGGTPPFAGETTIEGTTNEEERYPRYYIPSPIFVADVDGDGQNDLVVNKNLSTSSRLFENLKNYPSGEIHALTWDGLGLTELWRTRKIDGYISDFIFRQGGSPKEAELLVGVIIRGGASDILSNKTAAILTFPLDLSKKDQDEP